MKVTKIMDFKKILFGFMLSIALIPNIHSSQEATDQEATDKLKLEIAFNYILGDGMDDPEGLDSFLRDNLGTTDITDIVNSRGKTLRQEAVLYNANPAIFEVLNKYERISLLNKNPEEFFHTFLNEDREQRTQDEALEMLEREEIIKQEIRGREIAKIKADVLTDQDQCGICLREVTALAAENIQNYKTNCCKQFLCPDCIQNIKNAKARISYPLNTLIVDASISCPYCRTNPLLKNPVIVNFSKTPATAKTISDETTPA
jgi:actin-related protein